MPTINEIAKAAGCSPSTVSKALNDYPYVNKETKERVLEAAKNLGFTPNYFARSLMTKRSYLTGVLMSDDWNSGLLHPLFGGMIEGFKQSVHARNYELLFIRDDLVKDSSTNFVEHCRQRGIEGVYIVVGNMGERGIIDLIASNIPCVSMDLYDDKISTVLPDNGNGGFIATEYLIELGHKKIAHIAGNTSKPAGLDRFNGYKRALKAFGVPYNEKLVVHIEDYASKVGKEAMFELLERGEEFTAVFASSDSLAMGAIAACNERGIKIPDEISFIGFDDIDSASYFNPRLSTMHQSRVGAGRRAGDILIDMIENPDSPKIKHILVPTKLIIRDSAISASKKES